MALTWGKTVELKKKKSQEAFICLLYCACVIKMKRLKILSQPHTVSSMPVLPHIIKLPTCYTYVVYVSVTSQLSSLEKYEKREKQKISILCIQQYCILFVLPVLINSHKSQSAEKNK